jgi:hypothetical protein
MVFTPELILHDARTGATAGTFPCVAFSAEAWRLSNQRRQGFLKGRKKKVSTFFAFAKQNRRATCK